MSLDLLAIGDSKTVGYGCCVNGGGYRQYLLADFNAAYWHPDVEFSGAFAETGIRTSEALAQMPAFIATQTQDPEHILVNLGTNDLPDLRVGTQTEASWTAAMGDLIDLFHAQWPSAKVYLMRVYRSDYTAEQDAMDDTYIPAVLSTRSLWAFSGPDERTFLPGHVLDTTHPDTSGTILTAAAWQTAMGY